MKLSRIAELTIANALLIAAAPELLAACERILQEAQRDCIDESEWSEGEHMARAAIAKATHAADDAAREG